jgi:hypothetical protein
MKDEDDEIELRDIELSEEIEAALVDIDRQKEKLFDLIEYLERTGVLVSNPERFVSWESVLYDMRRRDEEQAKIRDMKRYLEGNGYLVVADENELDAAKLKKWISNKNDN